MAKAFRRVIRAASASHRGVVRSVSFKGFGAHTLRPPSRPCKPTRKRPGFLTQDQSLRPSCPQERLSGSKSLRGWVADQRSGPFPLHARITTESSGDSLGKGRGEQGRRFKWVPTGQPRLCSPSPRGHGAVSDAAGGCAFPCFPCAWKFALEDTSARAAEQPPRASVHRLSSMVSAPCQHAWRGPTCQETRPPCQDPLFLKVHTAWQGDGVWVGEGWGRG